MVKKILPPSEFPFVPDNGYSVPPDFYTEGRVIIGRYVPSDWTGYEVEEEYNIERESGDDYTLYVLTNEDGDEIYVSSDVEDGSHWYVRESV